MKKLVVLIVLMLMLSGCGVVAKGSGGGSGGGSSASPIPVSAYANFTGKAYTPSGILLRNQNKKVNADYQDRVYEQYESDGPYNTINTWLDNGLIKVDRYNWNSSTSSFYLVETIYDSYELNTYGLLSKRVFKQASGALDRIENYTYPSYSGTGNVMSIDLVTVYYSGTTTGITVNEQIVYERSVDGINVTENYYSGGSLYEKYCYTITY